MPPTLIAIVTLGSFKRTVDVPQLVRWPTQVMRLYHAGVIAHLPNAEGAEWEYTDEQLQVVRTHSPDRIYR